MGWGIVKLFFVLMLVNVFLYCEGNVELFLDWIVEGLSSWVFDEFYYGFGEFLVME